MKGILWYVTRKLEGIFDGILMEFRMRISEDKNQIKKSMYIPRFLSSSLYGCAQIFRDSTDFCCCLCSPQYLCYTMLAGVSTIFRLLIRGI